MKIIKYTAIIAALASVGSVTSCKNSDQDFPDYQGGTSVYFAKQSPVRTLVMGDDTYDTSMDNAHKCTIYATMGGAYKGFQHHQLRRLPHGRRRGGVHRRILQ